MQHPDKKNLRHHAERPFNQLNKGVKDAMVVSTVLVVRQFMTKTCKKAIYTNNNNLHKVTECRENHPRIRSKVQNQICQ